MIKTKLNSTPFNLILFFAVIICLLPFLFFFNLKGIYSQDDLFFHISRLENYYIAVSNGNLFPKIFPDAAKGYGYASDLFYPSLLLLPYAVLRMMGLSYVYSFLFFQIIVTLSTFFVTYFSIKLIFKDKLLRITFSVIYVLSVYRFTDQWIRGALGETMAFIFIPMIISSMYAILIKKSRNPLPLGVGMTLLILSHLLSAYITILVLLCWFIIFTIIYDINIERFIVLLKASLICIITSLFCTLPILEQLFTLSFKVNNAAFLWDTGLNAGELLVNSISSFLSVHIPGDFKPNFGIFLFSSTLLSIINYKALNKSSRYILFTSLFFIFASTPLFPWALLRNSFLATIQFPWRLLIFATFFLTWNAINLIKNTKNKNYNKTIIFTLIISLNGILSISSTANYLDSAKTHKILLITNDSYMGSIYSDIGVGQEYIPIDVDYSNMYRLSDEHIRDFSIVGYNTFSFKTDLEKEQKIVFPKLFYIGYTLTNNLGDKIPLFNEKGMLSAIIPSGKNTFVMSYSGTYIQKISFFISIIGTLIILIYFVYLKFMRKKYKTVI